MSQPCPVCNESGKCQDDHHHLLNALPDATFRLGGGESLSQPCPECGEPPSEPGDCQECGGTGRVPDDRRGKGSKKPDHSRFQINFGLLHAGV